MSYDFEGVTDRSPPKLPPMPPADPKDLEVIVTMLHLGAIYLTPDPSATFTFEELMAQIRELGGEELVLDEKDVRIVLPHLKTLKKEPGGRYSLK